MRGLFGKSWRDLQGLSANLPNEFAFGRLNNYLRHGYALGPSMDEIEVLNRKMNDMLQLFTQQNDIMDYLIGTE